MAGPAWPRKSRPSWCPGRMTAFWPSLRSACSRNKSTTAWPRARRHGPPHDQRRSQEEHLAQLAVQLPVPGLENGDGPAHVPHALPNFVARGVWFLGAALECFWFWHFARFRLWLYRPETRGRTFRDRGVGPLKPDPQHDFFRLSGHWLGHVCGRLGRLGPDDQPLPY